MDSRTPRDPHSKVLSRSEAVERLSRSCRGGRSLVLANGCFDILHVGHVRYIEGASAEGEILLVAINGDESVRRLKGAGRPLQTETDRAEILASLRAVDFVTVFNEDTVVPLIEALEPDVHCKGTDYTPETVPERQAVLDRGGRIAIVGDPKDHDSSAIIDGLK